MDEYTSKIEKIQKYEYTFLSLLTSTIPHLETLKLFYTSISVKIGNVVKKGERLYVCFIEEIGVF